MRDGFGRAGSSLVKNVIIEAVCKDAAVLVDCFPGLNHDHGVTVWMSSHIVKRDKNML